MPTHPPTRWHHVSKDAKKATTRPGSCSSGRRPQEPVVPSKSTSDNPSGSTDSTNAHRPQRGRPGSSCSSKRRPQETMQGPSGQNAQDPLPTTWQGELRGGVRGEGRGTLLFFSLPLSSASISMSLSMPPHPLLRRTRSNVPRSTSRAIQIFACEVNHAPSRALITPPHSALHPSTF